jgi:hypothetical protein
MVFGEFIVIASSVVELFPELRDLGFELTDFALEEFLLRLYIPDFLLLGEDDLLNFLVEGLLYVLEPLLVLGLVVVEHLLVHGDLLGEGVLNAVALLLHLAESVLEQTVVGCRFAHLARLLLDLLESSHLLKQHVVHQLARRVAQARIRPLPVLLGRKIIQFRRRLLTRKTAIQKLVHS